MALPHTPLFIGGQYKSAHNDETFEVRNPYSGKVVGTASAASNEDCKAAVDAAANAFKTWEKTSIEYRRDILLKAAELVATEKYKSKIIAAQGDETAAVPYWSLFNWYTTPNVLKTLAGSIHQLRGEVIPSGLVPGAELVARRRALGVIFSIAPWNAAFGLSVRAIAAPILCGNTVVLKCSEYSPKSQALAVELFQDAGVPEGVINFIATTREDAPATTAQIIAHPAVRKVTFTGSDRVGKLIAIEAAKHLKPCVLELGCKTPIVILDDANLELAAKAVAWGAMAHSGQICMSTERIIVQSGIADSLISAVYDLVKPLRAGDPVTDPNVQLAALFNEATAENVINLVREAQEEGAELMLGDLTRKGTVVQPHLLKGVKPGMRLWDTESFGPVSFFSVVDSVDEAIDQANDTEYSLSAALWTSDVHNGQKIASQINAGYVNINGSTIHSDPGSGMLGLGGSSGYGRFDIDEFTAKRVLVVHPMEPRKYPLFE
ncbi:Aldehyde/histidinol dehydrogenase [Crucibulum laeve]|uniref:Aldehyde/histidinol dehydrogenase n=1 Tax=Crucibulum laeve TaxID=68775 RepID=A0A5C3M8F1_9AGAR|nr:Aldehyde/histidinol dehydrogenase [Crucibulum laeve]